MTFLYITLYHRVTSRWSRFLGNLDHHSPWPRWPDYYTMHHHTVHSLQLTAHPVSFCSNTSIADHEQRTFIDVLHRIFPHPLSRNKLSPQEAFILLLAQRWLVFFILVNLLGENNSNTMCTTIAGHQDWDLFRFCYLPFTGNCYFYPQIKFSNICIAKCTYLDTNCKLYQTQWYFLLSGKLMFYYTSVAEIPGIQKDTNNGAFRHTLCWMTD